MMEQIHYNMLFRWFVGLAKDNAVWDASTFSKNRERLLQAEVATGDFYPARAQRPPAEMRD